MERPFPEDVRVGTFDYVTNRWTKRVVKRSVRVNVKSIVSRTLMEN
jgi:hypothetical protein